MALIVMKFGGTSVRDIERIEAVVGRIERQIGAGDRVVAVVSAMAGETNRLAGYCGDISPLYDTREYDTIVAAGEQVTAGLLALALQKRGVGARSWLGWQIPILTDDTHGRARIRSIGTTDLEARLAEGDVVVVAGFQGLSPRRRITTLGRGGTDTTAVAIAAALRADRCDIYTDVDGVYTSDPRIVRQARKLDKVTYEEMLEMASLGAKVLQTRSVELAMKQNVPVQVLSSFEDKPGTLVVAEEDGMEEELVSGIAHSRDEAKITLTGVPDVPGIAARVFGPLADAAINVDMIVQSISENGKSTDITFTLPRTDLERGTELLSSLRRDLAYGGLLTGADVVKISVVGVGMRSHAGVAQTMFRTLAENAINIQVISTSEIKISVLVAEQYTELALRALHTAYGLDAA